jgi:hypothetical protein
MKWAILKDELKSIKLSTPKDKKECFVPLDVPIKSSFIKSLIHAVPTNPKVLETELGKKGFRPWATYPFNYSFKTLVDYKKFQERYEIFCGGWVHYHDIITEKANEDHIIYFQWSEKLNSKGKYSVKIWISSPSKDEFANMYGYLPPPTSVDPPKPPPPPPPYA